MSVIDIISFLVILGFGLSVSIKGFVPELSSKTGYIVGFYSAYCFTNPLAYALYNLHLFGVTAYIAALIPYCTLFVSAYYFISWLGGVFSDWLERLKLTWLETLLGFILGIAEGIAIVVGIVYLMRWQNIINLDSYIENNSMVYNFLVDLM